MRFVVRKRILWQFSIARRKPVETCSVFRWYWGIISVEMKAERNDGDT